MATPTARATAVSILRKSAPLLLALALLNAAAWGAALVVFHGHPLLWGAGLLAYSFGLRHAFDVDHIAAIDNVTRKLMADGRFPLGAGFFFSLGHSSVVFALTVVIALAAGFAQDSFQVLKAAGSVAGTLVSATFLTVIALVNLSLLLTLWRRLRSGGDAEAAPRRRWRVLNLISRSWHMYPLGILFGLGFDTTTEIGLLGLSAAQAAQGLPLWTVLIFPLLFTAAMSAMDGLDGALMLAAYRWAIVQPLGRTWYNLSVTALSVAIALVVAGIEIANLLSDRLALKGAVWRAAGQAGAHFTWLGAGAAGFFLLLWLVSLSVQRFKIRPAAEN